jgi:hypothetical protein
MMAGEVLMPQSKRATTSRRQPRRKSAKAATRRKKTAPPAEQPPSDPRFVRDVIVRGEAASLTPSGKLPPDATHVITGGAADTTTIKRARFKTF